MTTNPTGFTRAAAWLLAGAGSAGAAHAVSLGDAEVHGFGTQTYMQASNNTYLGADSKGTWDNNFLGLVGTFTVTEQSKLWAQLETSSTEGTRFTWFFLDYQLSDTVRAHVGRVRIPLGIYNELIDTKLLQLASLEPAIYQGAADFVHDAYTGIGIDYDQSLGSAGSLLWQAYVGNVYDVEPSLDSRDRRAAGARVTYHTPVDGLRFLFSGYRTQVQLLATGNLVNEDRWLASADYVNHDWDLKSEYGEHHFNGINSDGWYVQLGRTFVSKWTPFARYDYVTLDKAQSASSSFTQKTLVAGVDYRVRSNISLRIENHFNHGYALPVASGEVIAGTGKQDWNLLVAGVHFMF